MNAMITQHFTIKPPAKRKKLRAVLEATQYAEVNFLTREFVVKGRITLDEAPTEEYVLTVLCFDEQIAVDDVLEIAAKQGLVRPTEYDVFLFGEQYPKPMLDAPLVFLHAPTLIWGGFFFYLNLKPKPNGWEIVPVSTGGEWRSKYYFAFRQKKK